MTDIEKIIKGLRCIKGDYIPCATCKYADADGCGRGNRCQRQCVSDAIALLKEREPYKSEEARLNRDEYCRVGDVLDCFDGMDMKADEVFHAVCLIEWAMSKRSVPLDQLLKEREPTKPVLDETTKRFYRCGACGEYVGFIDSDIGDPNEKDCFCRNCGRKVKWE